MLKAILTNRYVKFDTDDPDQIVSLKKHFRLRPKGYNFAPSFRRWLEAVKRAERSGKPAPSGGKGLWDGWENYLKHGKVSAGLYRHWCENYESPEEITEVVDVSKAPRFRPTSLEEKNNAWEHQIPAVEAMIAHSNCGGILLCATGTGKTKLAGMYLRRLIGTAIFVCDELHLLQQSAKELTEAIGEPVGVIGGGVYDPKRVTVVTPQTLAARAGSKSHIKWLRTVNVAIIDELHTQLNNRSFDILAKGRFMAVFGLTATLDGFEDNPEIWMRAAALTGPVIYRWSIKQAEHAKQLTRGRVFSVPVSQPSMDKASQETYSHLIVRSKKRNSAITKLVEGLYKGRARVAILVERRAHVRILEKRLEALNIPYASLHGSVPIEQRGEAIARMEAGKLHVIISTRVFTKGVNLKTLTALIDATARSSANNAQQRYGRGVRLAAGKAEFCYYDITDRGNVYADAADKRLKALGALGVKVSVLK